jgi:hypothetical protein
MKVKQPVGSAYLLLTADTAVSEHYDTLLLQLQNSLNNNSAELQLQQLQLQMRRVFQKITVPWTLQCQSTLHSVHSSPHKRIVLYRAQLQQCNNCCCGSLLC